MSFYGTDYDEDGNPIEPPEEESYAHRMLDGGTFILDLPEETPAVWGDGDSILWAQGEALIIVGGNGVGKTTLAAQIIRGRIGLQKSCLGMPVLEGERRVLYLAMDRPAQARRALHRLFRNDPRHLLEDRLLFWKGPPPVDLARYPQTLAELCKDAGADTVVVDSLKDAALGLSEDEVGAAWNRARQTALTAGVEVLELHHNVKRGANGGPPTSIADVYGSAWITAGAGSVIALHGDPGDPVVDFRQLKQPAEEVGPWKIEHDHDRGVSGIWHAADLVDLARRAPSGITLKAAASAIFDTDKPTPAQIEKARRKLRALEKTGHLEEDKTGAPSPSVWRPGTSISGLVA